MQHDESQQTTVFSLSTAARYASAEGQTMGWDGAARLVAGGTEQSGADGEVKFTSDVRQAPRFLFRLLVPSPSVHPSSLFYLDHDISP